MNIELLKKVKAKILEEPRQFDMRRWYATAFQLGRKVPNCGTTACIGGWAVAIKNSTNPRTAQQFIFAPRRYLHLNDAQGYRLFHIDNWPKRFMAAYRKTRSVKKRAAIAAKRIDHFIKTMGLE